MIFLAPFLVKMALEFGPAEVCSLMLVSCSSPGSTRFQKAGSRASPLSPVFGLLSWHRRSRHQDPASRVSR